MSLQDESGNVNESEIPSEVMDAFAEVFDNASADDLAEAGDDSAENTEAAKPSETTIARRRQSKLEQQQELAEEGLESPDGEEIETPSDAVTDTEEEEGKEAPVAAAETNPLEGLDANHLFAAQQLGWTDEQIGKLAAADPELAASTLSQLADTYGVLSRQMLNGTLVNPGFPVQQQPAQPQAPTSNLDKFYAQLEAFTAANGEDLGAFAKALKSEVIDPFKTMLAEAEVSRESARRSEAQGTMKNLSGKFGDFYGTDAKPLTIQQQQARAMLGQVADQLRAGASMQGQQLSITEALNRAHLIVSSNHQRQAVRTEIKQSLQKRAKTITARPTQRLNKVQASGRSREKAEEGIARFWADQGVADID